MDTVMGLRRARRQFGDCPAVIDGDTRLTWEAFDIRTRKLAAALRDLGLISGDRVALLMINSYHYLELYYAVARIAGYKVPRSFTFVDALPKSGAGKVLKRELRAAHW